MADTLLNTGNIGGFVDIRLNRANAGAAPGNIDSTTNYNDITKMRAYLTAQSAYYTAAVLNNMTINDMVYAVRLFEGGSVR